LTGLAPISPTNVGVTVHSLQAADAMSGRDLGASARGRLLRTGWGLPGAHAGASRGAESGARPPFVAL